MTGPGAAAELQGALRDATAALERGDAPAAAAAMASAAKVCVAAEREGVRLAPGDLELAHSLWEQCGQAAERHVRELEASLLQLGTSRRAVGAYRRR